MSSFLFWGGHGGLVYRVFHTFPKDFFFFQGEFISVDPVAQKRGGTTPQPNLFLASFSRFSQAFFLNYLGPPSAVQGFWQAQALGVYYFSGFLPSGFIGGHTGPLEPPPKGEGWALGFFGPFFLWTKILPKKIKTFPRGYWVGGGFPIFFFSFFGAQNLISWHTTFNTAPSFGFVLGGGFFSFFTPNANPKIY